MKTRLENVTKRFGRSRVLSSVDLELPEGAIVALVGVNGAGKTTLLQAASGLLALDGGRLLMDGEPFRRDRLDLRRRFLYLPDFPNFIMAETPIEHIGMMLRMYERDMEAAKEPVIELLREFDLLALAEQRLEHLSRGQQYKVALTAAMAVRPDLWLLDEPLASGMDPLGLRVFQRRAREAASAGCTVLYTTQILEVAERFSDYVAVLHDGRIRAFTRGADLRAAGEAGGLGALFDSLADPNA